MADQFTTHPPYARWAHVLLRIYASLVIMQHGAQKLFGVLGGVPQSVGSLLWFGGIIEFFVAFLVLIGLYARPAAFLVSGMMASAYFMVHFPQGFWPVENGGEPSSLLCFIFLYFAATGAGAYSIDYRRNRANNPALTA